MALPLRLTVPSLYRHKSNNLTKPSTPNFLQTSCVHKQQIHNPPIIINRRNTVVGLTLFTTNQALMALGSPENVSSQILSDFGSEPRELKETIRIIVPRPNYADNSFSKGETVEVLKVEDIEVPHNDSVRFDVYVANGDGDGVGSDLGEFAGSLVEESRLRMGRNYSKRGLSLGITNLLKRIGAEGSKNLVVSLVPRAGVLSIGGVRIEHIQAS